MRDCVSIEEEIILLEDQFQRLCDDKKRKEDLARKNVEAFRENIVLNKVMVDLANDAACVRADKLQAMADAAKAKAQLHALGINSDFLLNPEQLVKEEPLVTTVKRNIAKTILITAGITALVVTAVFGALHIFVL